VVFIVGVGDSGAFVISRAFSRLHRRFAGGLWFGHNKWIKQINWNAIQAKYGSKERIQWILIQKHQKTSIIRWPTDRLSCVTGCPVNPSSWLIYEPMVGPPHCYWPRIDSNASQVLSTNGIAHVGIMWLRHSGMQEDGGLALVPSVPARKIYREGSLPLPSSVMIGFL
jgi:hypothetical protein